MEPKEAGYTQGYLLQQAISSLRANAEFCIFTLARQKRPSELVKVLNAVKSKIPERFLLELEGIVEGYNAKKGRFEKSISLDDLLYLEESSSFDEAEAFVKSHRALGPYHLTVSDSTKSGTFSLYQKEDWTNNWNEDRENGYRLRLLSNKDPLITTNCSCTPQQHDMFNGKHRETRIKEYLDENQQIKNRPLA